MTRFLFDTAVFLYARGREHEYRESCRQLVRLSEDGALAGEASVELVQEFAHVLRRRGLDGPTVRDQALAVASLCRLHDVEEPDLRLALSLVASVPALGMRDAVHAATALHRGIGVVVSPDRAFDRITGLERLDPRDAVSTLVSTTPTPGNRAETDDQRLTAERPGWPG